MKRQLGGGLELDDDRRRIDIGAVHDFLVNRSYWGSAHTLAQDRRNLSAAARVVGVYEGARQVGYARVISDGVSIAYLADVYILAHLRGQGLGSELVREAIDRGPLAGLNWLLNTRDAQRFYERLGFCEPQYPGMERRRADPGG